MLDASTCRSQVRGLHTSPRNRGHVPILFETTRALRHPGCESSKNRDAPTFARREMKFSSNRSVSDFRGAPSFFLGKFERPRREKR